MNKKALSIFSAGLLALCSTGCMATKQLTDYKKEGFYAGINARGGVAIRQYNIKNMEEKEVPVHPDDAGFLTGSTMIKADKGTHPTIGLGLEGIAGYENLSLVSGIDAEFGGSISYKKKIQQSDGRGKTGAYLYDSVRTNIISPVPFVGARYAIGDLELSYEFGFPMTTFKREWGHHRYNKEERIGREKDSVTGKRQTAGVKWKFDKDFSAGLFYSKEDYNLKFGKAKSASIGLLFGFDF